ncbi:MAG: hypothetical protein IJW35_04835 [Lentisphaeria bacterium]|nr:hypothetical protein [Lentisphaeria bacterium]
MRVPPRPVLNLSDHELTDQDILNIIAIASRESRKRKRGKSATAKTPEDGARFAVENAQPSKKGYTVEYVNENAGKELNDAEEKNGNPTKTAGSSSNSAFVLKIAQNALLSSGFDVNSDKNVRCSIAPDIGSAAFKNWFADSNVVDQNGKPLMVYHGSSAVFYAFDPKKIKSGAFGKGIYLSPSKANARAYGSNVMALYAKIAKPYIIRENLGSTAAHSRIMSVCNCFSCIPPSLGRLNQGFAVCGRFEWIFCVVALGEANPTQ